jgi:hypothetical protein
MLTHQEMQSQPISPAEELPASPSDSGIEPLDLDDVGGTVYDGAHAAGHRRLDREYGPSFVPGRRVGLYNNRLDQRRETDAPLP